MTTYFNQARGKWMYNFVRGGKRYAAYCTDEQGGEVSSRRAADACEARVKRQVEQALSAGRKGVVISGAYTLEEMFADYVAQHAGRQRSWASNMRKHIKELLDFFGRPTAAASLTVDDVERFIGHSRRQPRAVYRGGPRKGAKSVERKNQRCERTTRRTVI